MSIEPGAPASPPEPYSPQPVPVQRMSEPGRPGPPSGPIPVRITNAFSVGFYAFWGAFLASIVIWVLAFVMLAACGGVLYGALRSAQPTP